MYGTGRSVGAIESRIASSRRRSRRSWSVHVRRRRTDFNRQKSTMSLCRCLGCLGCRLRLRIYFACCYYQTHGIERTTVKPTSQPNKRKGSRTEPRYDRMASAQVGRSVGRSLSDSRLLSRSAVACCLLFNGHPGGYPDERRRGPRVLHSVRPAHSPPHPFGLSSAFGVCAPSANPQARDGKIAPAAAAKDCSTPPHLRLIRSARRPSTIP